MNIHVKCPVFPTENQEHIKYALANLFSDVPLDEEIDLDVIYISFTTSSQNILSSFRQLIHRTQIIDAVRVRLQSNLEELRTWLLIDKQTAFCGQLRLVASDDERPPLGCIEVIFQFGHESELEDFLVWLTPPTKNGRIIKS